MSIHGAESASLAGSCFIALLTILFTDDTLREMAANPPYAMEDLLEITGVTELKAKRFGQSFLEVVYKFLPQLIPGKVSLL